MSSVNNVSYSHLPSVRSVIDEEYERIMRKMMQYGMRPSGNKNIDKERLHAKELQEAQKESCISNKFLTVTKAEQEKIQAKKKIKQEENDIQPQQETNPTKGQEILGEQLMLAINMKQKKKKTSEI